MKFLSIFLIFFLLEGSPQWGSDFDKAKSDAIQNHKYIVINFSGSDWCDHVSSSREIFLIPLNF